MERYKLAKFISSGSIMLLIFQILLIIFGRFLLNTIVIDFNQSHILYIPLILAYLGISYASYRFKTNNDYPWTLGEKIGLFIASGSILIGIAQITFVSITETGSIILYYLAFLMMVGAYCLLGYGFYLLIDQMEELWAEDYIIKEPKIFLPLGHFGLALVYLLFLISYIILRIHENLALFFSIIGIAGVLFFSVINVIGYIRLNLAFRTYPMMFEDQLKKKKGKRN